METMTRIHDRQKGPTTASRDRLLVAAAGVLSPRAVARAGDLHPFGVFILMAGAFLPLADFFIVNVALPTIDTSLHASPAALELIVAGYGVAYAAMLVLGGRLGDRIGRHQLFQFGAAGFVAASALCGLSPDIWVLVAARVIQGIFAAMLVPQVLATFQATMDGERKTRALALYVATGGLAAVAGQIAGGMLVTANILGSSWRSIFLINIPFGIAVLVVARYVVPATRSDLPTGIDVPGTLAFAATLVALLVPLTEGDTLHWPAWGWVLIAAAAVLGAVTLLIERRSERAGHTPLLPPSLLTLRSTAWGLAMYLAFSVGFGGFLFVFALTVQDGLHADALVGGLAVVPMAAPFLVGSILSRKIINRFGRAAMAGGAILQAAELALLIIVIVTGWPHVAIIDLAGPLTLLGFGQSMMSTGLYRVVLVDVPAHQAGIGSGVLVTMQQTGQALGVAILGSIYLSFARHSIPVGFAVAIGIQLGISVLFAMGSRFLPSFTGTASGRNGAMSAATPATPLWAGSRARLAAAASTRASASWALIPAPSTRCVYWTPMKGERHA
jgi:MFS family permease